MTTSETSNPNLVSIIMPNKNKGSFIEQSIASVSAQTYQDWELIIIDDASNDGSAAAIEKAAKTDTRITPIYLENGFGRSGPVRNAGIAKAKGRYLAFIDSDDVWFPQKLEQQLKYMQAHASTLCTTHTEIIDEHNNITGEYCPTVEKANWSQMIAENYVSTSATIIDRSTAPEIYFIDSPRCQDYACWMSIIKQSGHADIMPEKLSQYRINPELYILRKIPQAYYRLIIHRKYLNRTLPQTLVDAFRYTFAGIQKSYNYLKRKHG